MKNILRVILISIIIQIVVFISVSAQNDMPDSAQVADSTIEIVADSTVKIVDDSTSKAAVEEIFPDVDSIYSVDELPDRLYDEAVVYPIEARPTGIKLNVYVKSLVDEKGKVRDVVVNKSSRSEYSFDEAAVTAAYKCQYEPAKTDNKPVPYWVTTRYDFKPDEEWLDKAEAAKDIEEDKEGKKEDKAIITKRPESPAPDQFVAVETAPEIIYKEEPVYPEIAKKDGIEATVWIKCLVDTSGNVLDASVQKGVEEDYGFNDAALEAAYQYKFKPAIQGGQPVKVWSNIRIDFKMPNKTEESSGGDN